jgi:hypothetical protein
VLQYTYRNDSKLVDYIPSNKMFLLTCMQLSGNHCARCQMPTSQIGMIDEHAIVRISVLSICGYQYCRHSDMRYNWDQQSSFILKWPAIEAKNEIVVMGTYIMDNKLTLLRKR